MAVRTEEGWREIMVSVECRALEAGPQYSLVVVLAGGDRGQGGGGGDLAGETGGGGGGGGEHHHSQPAQTSLHSSQGTQMVSKNGNNINNT